MAGGKYFLGTGMFGSAEDSENEVTVYATEMGGGEVDYATFQGTKLKDWDNIDGDCETKPAAAAWEENAIVVC
eukprot:scaffold162215_cov33-Prasinocladus_malaysianus.AAC.1